MGIIIFCSVGYLAMFSNIYFTWKNLYEILFTLQVKQRKHPGGGDIVSGFPFTSSGREYQLLEVLMHSKGSVLSLRLNPCAVNFTNTSDRHLTCSQQAAQHRQLSLKIPDWWHGSDTPTASGQPVPGLSHSHSTKAFPDRWSLPHFSLCPLPLVLSLGTTEKSLAPFSLQFSVRYLYSLIRSPWAFSSPGWTVPFHPYERCSSPLIISMVLCWSLPSSFLPLVLESL